MTITGELRNLDLTRLLTAVLVLLASSYLPLAELLTRVDTGIDVSLNLVLSLVVAAVAAVVVLRQGSWLVVTVPTVILLVPIIVGVAEGNAIRHLQYMVPTFTFVVVAFVILSAGDLRWTQRSMIVAALLVLPTWVVAWIGLEFPLPRASDPVVPLAVLVLLYWTGTQERWFRGVAIASVLGLLSYLAMTTSRMGSAVTLMVVLIWIWTSSRWSVMIKALTSTALVAASTLFWFGGAWGRERLLGRDATIGIGPIRINGEGRVEAANLALGPMPSPASSLGFWQVVAGNGGGTSGQRLVDAGFILDKPHNEFLRAFVDGGLILTAGLAAMICLPLVIGILNYRRTREKTLLLLPMSVSLILLSFSLTDNAMSYIWLMLPAGVLVSWSRSRAVNGSPVPTTRFADQPP